MNTVRPAITGTAQRGSALTGDGRHLERHRQQHGLPVAALQQRRDLGRHRRRDGLDVRARDRRRRRDRARARRPTTNPERSASAASNATATVAGDGPVNTVAPTISGTAQRTAALTSTPGTWSGNGNALRLPVAALRRRHELGRHRGRDRRRLRARRRRRRRARCACSSPPPTRMAPSSRASAPTATVKAAPPVNTALPIVTGATLRGTTLSASQGTWSGPAIGLRLPVAARLRLRVHGHRRRDRHDVHARRRRRGLDAADPRHRHQRRRERQRHAASARAWCSGGPPVNTVRAGDLRHRAAHRHADVDAAATGAGSRTTTPTSGSAARPGDPFTDIAGATGTTYTLDSADVGDRIRLRVTASNLDGTAQRDDQRGHGDRRRRRRRATPDCRASAARRRLGATLTATPGDWTPAGADFAYAWQRDGVDIAGATGSTYTLQAADAREERPGQGHRDQRRRQRERDLRATERVAAPPVNTVAPARAVGNARRRRPRSPPSPAPGTPRARRSRYTWLRCPADATAVSDGCEEAGTGEHVHARGRRRRPPPRRPRRSRPPAAGRRTAAGALTAHRRPRWRCSTHAAEHRRQARMSARR